MLRRVFLVLIVLFLSVFGINRINNSQSSVQSNFLIINSIEEQNLNDIVDSVKFHIPSFAMEIQHTNNRPYLNAEGKVEVRIGNTVENDLLTQEVKNANNNFLLHHIVEYNNTEKKISIVNRINEFGELEHKAYRKAGDLSADPLHLITLQ